MQYVKIDPKAPYQGATLQAAMSIFKMNKFIEGYAVVKGKEKMIEAINSGKYIYTGSNRCARSKTMQEGRYYLDEKPTGGHAFVIVDYVSD